MSGRQVVTPLLLREVVVEAARKHRATTDSAHSRPVAPNTLDRDFTATAPNQKWVRDITYLWIEAGWLYPSSLHL
jgi:transposase InsO family protein